ncbi:F-actin-capping protein subunit beta [Cadophora gregata]|uniref:F-actin-capping protein subunit beta n=1 Tax=Cadophora gregata TaxID=51156 RepID=UPI0026DC1150|nr:F-actin-capping protein subunit beta [Cadophora gregata]KAK0104827.1 F-actin-capping protein subunit beta [Cadophora gregata]KAK0115091.1 F-actin-capping protein subunit beta [Cadophora gregata f. sp. sojae]
MRQGLCQITDHKPRRNCTARSPCRRTPTISLWVVAVCLAATCCYKAEIGEIGLLPVLTPLILIVERKPRDVHKTSNSPDQWSFSPLSNTIWGTAFTAFLLSFVLSKWTLIESALSAIPVACLLLVYVALVPRTSTDSFRLPQIDIEEHVVSLSFRTIIFLLAALSIQTVLFGFPSGIYFSSVLSGTAKALSWYCTIQAAKHTSWSIAPRIVTFGVMSTRNPFMESSGPQCVLNIISTFLAHTQVIYLCPRKTKYRPSLWILALISVIPYAANIYNIRLAEPSTLLSFDSSMIHPVEQLMQHAKADFASLLQRQSQNYTSAHAEYRRRYSIDPPPGFENWYNFAVRYESPIIDEFDMIFDTISPFRKLSGLEVSAMMDRALSTPEHNLWSCVFSGKNAETSCTHPWRTNDRHISTSFNALLGELPGILPDLKFLVNHLDEPRVLVPPVSLQGDKQNFKQTNMAEMPNWDVLTKFCNSQQQNKTSESKHRVELFDIPFIADRSSAIDLCQHPEYSSMHGLFMSATSFQLFEGFVPILSTGAPSTMGDILFPSPAYNESGFQYDPSHDIPWEKKKNNLYWAGSTTGGFATDKHDRPDEWRLFQRQRFVTLAQNLQPKQQHHYLRPSHGLIKRISSSFLNLKLYNVGFTNLLQTTLSTWHSQRLFFPLKPWADKDLALHSQLVFDLDGNGISGRYYKLLASRSTPLKQTVLREWHDERLVPWVHYVPVSLGMQEVPELVMFLTSTGRGRRAAREIAENGREWFGRGMRDVDRRVYVYRLMLEMARLQDPERLAS